MRDLHEGSLEAQGPDAAAADVLLIHPALAAESARIYLHALWPDGDPRQAPPGYLEVSSALFDLRAFCRAELRERLPQADATLPARVREWIDGLAQSWSFPDALAVRDLDFWAFLRSRMIAWLHSRMAERRLIEHLAADGELSVLAVGVSADQRALLRALSDARKGALHSEIATLPPPAFPQPETIAEMRLRKLFGLFQDGWHGVRLLVEDLLVRRPKVLLVSDSRSWERGRSDDALRGRSDAHLERVWREGRRRPLRLYYRIDRYDPDVGAMTAGRLAPTYLRHFLFLLAQTSRGYWEVRKIQRQWRALRENPAFQEALVFEGLKIGEMILGWMDEAIAHQLPSDVRTTRREAHFLLGARPEVVLLGQEPEDCRALVAAARKLRIPTVGVQLRPFSDWDHAYLLTPRSRPGSACLADRLCVFSREAKAFLVEQGACDPPSVVITGDPRRDWLEERGTPSAAVIEQIRRRWGVEAGQRVVALACRPAQGPEVLDAVMGALAGRDDAFLLFHPCGEAGNGKRFYHRMSGRAGLRWLHCMTGDPFADWLQAVDLLVATTWADVAEAILSRTPVVFVRCGEQAAFSGPEPGDLIGRAATPEELRAAVEDALAHPGRRLPADERWHAFIEGVYGPGDGAAARRIMEIVEGLTRGT